MKTFHLASFGCRASQADGAAIKRQLLEAGLQEAATADRTDLVVLNTCTVTARADAEARQVIRRIRRENPLCRIVVTGCYAQRAAEEIAELGATWVVGNSHKHRITEILGLGTRGVQDEAQSTFSPQPSVLGGPPTTAGVFVGEIAEEFHFAPVFPDDRTRPTLKVQDGCDARCSFCVIPEVRGRSRSLASERVTGEVRRLEAEGYHEIVLSGINLGSYGRDLGRSVTFLGLLERILDETTIPRIRISSIEPMDVSRELIRLVASEPRCAEHFHVPLQSGSDRILRLMNRRYWTSHYAERILAIREALPQAAIGADVMVGFPGETAADHATSARFIESLPFTYLHVFPYSARPGTPAAAKAGRVNGRVAHQRSEEIRALASGKAAKFREAQIGRTLPALTLGSEPERGPVALSSNYVQVSLPASGFTPNTLVDVRVENLSAGRLFGRPLPSLRL